MRLLIVAFCFPPTGGGVQRTLRFCKFLPEFGIDVHVLAPEDSKWFARDERLLASVPESTTLHRCRFAATGTIAQELGRMHPTAAHKTTVIENGADFDDFEGLSHERNQRFTIVHAGSFLGHRTPATTLLAVQRAADALLLLIPHAGGRGDSVLSGKLFEHVAARRPILAAVPPNGAAANLIRGIGAVGVVDGVAA